MNVAETSKLFVQQQPLVRSCLKRGLINYSALARAIIKDTELTPRHFDAVVVSLRRFHQVLCKKNILSSSIMRILEQSKLEIHTKIVVLVVSKGHYFELLEPIHKKARWRGDVIRVIEGVDEVTIISSDNYVSELKENFRYKLKKINDNLVEVILRSPKLLEDTPGVMSFLYSLLAEHNINVVETMSCWTDTIFVLDKKDLGQVVALFEF